ncbi:MAG: bifunctional diguanylate cyclase/phosphodiesterase [Treponema sp.]|nr:bifunctional diguanylate cyclase/phosphodiesterase [Treponema sp.]
MDKPLDYKDVFDTLPQPALVVFPEFDDKGSVCRIKVLRENAAYTDMMRSLTVDGNKSDLFRQELKAFPALFGRAMEAGGGQPSFEMELDSKVLNSRFKIETGAIEGGGYVMTLLREEKIRPAEMQESSKPSLDPLTGLPDRSFFNRTFDGIIDTAVIDGQMVGIVLIDIDNMKSINDSSGHIAGDSILRRSAHLIDRFAGEDCLAFRYGDDEFLVLFTKLPSKDRLATVSDVIFDSFQNIGIRISAGIAVCPDDSSNSTDLLKFADLAVKRAKRNGKNNMVFFEQKMYDDFLHRSLLQQKLIITSANGSFEQYYQPQFNLQDNTLRGFEALLRWNDPTLGMISPEEFIPIAEETHVICELGSWVLKRACATLREWREKYGFQGVMSVNVSPSQLLSIGFIPDLEEAIRSFAVQRGTLEVEITEGIFIHDVNRIVPLLRKIRELGVLVSLDDFGTGYSSFRYLQYLPIDTLKVDKAFISNLTDQPSLESNIAESIISLGNKLGLETIAEGVEREEQVAVLRQMNCRILQGFFRGRPMRKERCDAVLAGDLSQLDRIGSEPLAIGGPAREQPAGQGSPWPDDAD